MEELCIKNITNGFRKIRLNGNMAKAEMIEAKQKVATALNKLKEINPYLYQDYLNDYKALLKR